MKVLSFYLPPCKTANCQVKTPPNPLEFTEADNRQLAWLFEGGGHLTRMICANFRNVDTDCTAQNCPCGDYEVER